MLPKLAGPERAAFGVKDFMAKLMVQRGKRSQPFHPTLRLRNTGYSDGHWLEMCFRPGVFCGAGTIRERNLPEAIAHYFEELKRLGHVEVKSE